MEVKIDKFGRILIPKEIRTRLGLRAGQVFELAVEDEVAIHLEPKARTEPRIVMTDFGFPVIHFDDITEPIDFDVVEMIHRDREERMRKISGV